MEDHHNGQGWLPKASRQSLAQTAAIYHWIRAFFHERDILEVHTPVLSRAGTTDRHIESFCTAFQGAPGLTERALYLITSPEFHMKRLLAAGYGDIYQMCRVFRQSELGPQHNPEFTLLEWYRVGYDHHQLMIEVAELVNGVLTNCASRAKLDYEQLSYREVFLQHLGLDPLTTSAEELRHCAQQHQFVVPQAQDPYVNDNDVYLDFLMSHVVQPKLGRGKLSFVYDYPASQCALARLSDKDNRVAERFELFVDGVELANGFNELCDAQQQQQRFEQDIALRQRAGQASVTLDHHLIAALASGLPDCAGVAIGIERLIQLAQQQQALENVLAFPFIRA